MSQALIARARSRDDGEPRGARGPDLGPVGGRAAADIALWVFIGCAGTLFTLFITAYVMRMDGTDWTPLGLPRQLFLSTALLIGASVALQAAAVRAADGHAANARTPLVLGGACGLAFLAVQLWAWGVLLAGQVVPQTGPAAGFFFLLTAMHGLHVTGGLAGWYATWRRNAHPDRYAADARRRAVVLCARYWHFLLAVWIALYATLAGVTPAIVGFVCGTR
ncbi:bb3-type cytochrome oxidase subunit III [Oxalobacteraceae bacterium OM1]|nr:bb3-type cytochrome oxidase subunit III [Oxalobacteraceae bacterium OM1]